MMKSQQGQSFAHESDEDDEEETVELRVSASRQEQKHGVMGWGAKRGIRRMSSSTSAHLSHQGMEEGDEPYRSHIPVTTESRLPTRVGATPLLELTKNVISATAQKVNSGIGESVVEAMQLLPQSLQSNASQRKKQEVYGFASNRAEDAKEDFVRMKLQAFWQLLLTGFEVLKFSIGKRAKKYVLWLALDGKLYLGERKTDKHSARWIFLADVYRVQKGNDSQSFTKSQSWRDARGKDNVTFSLHGRHGKEDRIFAIQVWKPTVRNILFENFEALLRVMKSDADGEFPYVAQRVIAQHYAATGEILSLRQVEDVLLREEDERKSSATDGNDRDSVDGGGSSGDSDHSDAEGDQRDILG